jgi:hypothetical protein
VEQEGQRGDEDMSLYAITGTVIDGPQIDDILEISKRALAPNYLPGLGRRRRPARGTKVARRSEPAVSLPERLEQRSRLVVLGSRPPILPAAPPPDR